MKIEANCGTCGRRFLLSQIGSDSEAPGRCPFCGTRFARHYSTILEEAVDQAEATAAQFVRAISRLQGVETGFDIDIEGLLRSIHDLLREEERASSS
jgi:DNA-directed RNA polymerase subunit RPC12/RpoP